RAALPWSWNANHRLRRFASHTIARAALTSSAHTFIQEGVSFGYADGGQRVLEEDSPTNYRGAVATMPEAISATHILERGGQRGVCLLFGRFYGDDAMTRDTLAQVKAGKPVLLGDPQGWVSMIHLES